MSSRSPDAEVSSGPFPGWEALWPEIAAEIERKVRRKLPAGVEPSDISNEVAARLLAAANVPPADRLRFWCLAVARYVVADLYRRRTLPERDLPPVQACDVEQMAISRLRLLSVVEAVADLSQADRDALTRTLSPMTNAVKARRKRARQRIRERMTQSVGAVVAIRRLRWLVASGAVTAALPVVGAVGWLLPSAVESAPRSETHVAEPVASGGHATEAGPGDAAGLIRDNSPRQVRPRVTHRPADAPLVAVAVPGASGDAGAGSFEPSDGGPTPLACARSLRLADDICVARPEPATES